MELRPVQMEALAAAAFRPGFAFFMEQGLGKTATVLAEFRECVKHYDATLLVVVCPNSFKEGWRREAQKQGFNEFEFFIYESSQHKRIGARVMKETNKVPVLVLNYEAVRSSKVQTLIMALCAKHPVSYLALDESICIKNHKSAQTKACISLSKLFDFKRLLSGKPVTQGPHDVWSQLRAIGELDGSNFFAFRNRFCLMGGYMGKQVIGARNEEELSRIISAAAFKARKDDWLKSLPPKSYTLRGIPLHPKIQSIYEEMQEHFMADLGDGTLSTADLVLTRLMRQSQMASGFAVNEEGEEIDLVEPKQNTRLMYVREAFEAISGKLVVVTRFRRTAAAVLDMYSDLNPTFILGGMTGEEVEDNKMEFNEGDSQIIVINSAAKYGHTLHANGDCSDMLMLENDYNLDTRSQIEDRIHRDGQPNACLYTDLYSTPLDADMMEALQRKEDIAAKLMGYTRTMMT